MPIVDTVEGYRWDVPQEWIDRGNFRMLVNRIGPNGIIHHEVLFERHFDGEWRAENLPPEDEEVVEHEEDPSQYSDDLEAPEFIGWELVVRADCGKYGDVYVCIDPNMRDDWAKMGNPTTAKASGNAFVNPDYGNTKPGPGYRIYRKKKLLGPVRLLPSEKFSEPLPLP